MAVLAEYALIAPAPPRRKLPTGEMLRGRIRGSMVIRQGRLGHGEKIKAAACGPHALRNVPYILDSERISACCAASSGRIATSGSTLTSTVRTASGVPSAGRAEASDGTCSVTDTTRQSVLG